MEAATRHSVNSEIAIDFFSIYLTATLLLCEFRTMICVPFRHVSLGIQQIHSLIIQRRCPSSLQLRSLAELQIRLRQCLRCRPTEPRVRSQLRPTPSWTSQRHIRVRHRSDHGILAADRGTTSQTPILSMESFSSIWGCRTRTGSNSSQCHCS